MHHQGWLTSAAPVLWGYWESDWYNFKISGSTSSWDPISKHKTVTQTNAAFPSYAESRLKHKHTWHQSGWVGWQRVWPKCMIYRWKRHSQHIILTTNTWQERSTGNRISLNTDWEKKRVHHVKMKMSSLLSQYAHIKPDISILLLIVLGTEPRALCMLDKHSTIVLYP